MSEKRNRKPTHPGAIFSRQLLTRLDLSTTQAAKYLGVERQTLSNFCNGKTRCSVDMAGRIAAATGSNTAVWLNMQAAVDAWEAEQRDFNVTTFPKQNVA